MNIFTALMEMPMATFQTMGKLGQDKDSKEFNLGDWKVSHTHKAIAKIFRIFERTPYWFNFIIAFGKTGNSMMFDHTTDVNVLSDLIGKPLITDGRITMVLNNHTTSLRNRMPISAWTLAHRFGHAVHLNNGEGEAQHPIAKVWYAIDKELNEFFTERFSSERLIGGKARTAMAAIFCTFKSARDDNINSHWEVVADLFAQYLISGSIRLNRLETITQPLLVNCSTISSSDRYQIDQYLNRAEQNLNKTMKIVLDSLVGKIVGF